MTVIKKRKRENWIARAVVFSLSAVLIFFAFLIIAYILYRGSYSRKTVLKPYTPEISFSVAVEGSSEPFALIVPQKNGMKAVTVDFVREAFSRSTSANWGRFGDGNLRVRPFAVDNADSSFAAAFRDWLRLPGGRWSRSAAFGRDPAEVIRMTAAAKGGLGVIPVSAISGLPATVRVLGVWNTAVVYRGSGEAADTLASRTLAAFLAENGDYEKKPYDRCLEEGLSPVLIESVESRWILTPGFFFSAPADSGRIGGIGYFIINTLYLVIFSLLLSLPLGIGAALYLVYYARKGKVTAFVREGISVLSGVPSILIGIFGFAAFVPLFGGMGFLPAVLSIAIMILPILIKTAEEAFKAVPEEALLASYALGGGKRQTLFRVALSAASNGILSGVILSVGRVIGETAILIFTLGFGYDLYRPLKDPGASAMTLSQNLYFLFQEGISEEKSFGCGAVLILLVLCVNAVAVLTVRRSAGKTALRR